MVRGSVTPPKGVVPADTRPEGGAAPPSRPMPCRKGHEEDTEKGPLFTVVRAGAGIGVPCTKNVSRARSLDLGHSCFYDGGTTSSHCACGPKTQITRHHSGS